MRPERAQAMGAQTAQLRTHAEDGSNLAEVTVDSNGVLVDLVLTERTCNFEPPAGPAR